MERIYLQSLPVDLGTPAQIIERITGWISRSDRFRQIVTLNALMAMTAQADTTLAGVIQRADLVTVDGYGIAAAIARYGRQAPPRLPGVVLIQHLLSWCDSNSRRVCFYGGTPQTALGLKEVIIKKWPGLTDSYIRDGYISGDIRGDILKQQPDLLLVGLGSPAQEICIAKLAGDLKHTVAIGVGGSFEIIAGLKREAPPIIRQSGLEWAYRMLQDPRRMNRIPQLIGFWYHYLR